MRKHPLGYLWDRLRRSLQSALKARRSNEQQYHGAHLGERSSEERRPNERNSSKWRSFELNQELLQSLQGLAEQEQRPVQNVAADLLSMGLDQQHASREFVRRWGSLSPRERQVAILVRQNLTNRQIASQLGISPETVKTYLRHVLYKFGLNSKTELRMLLADWDLTNWEGA